MSYELRFIKHMKEHSIHIKTDSEFLDRLSAYPSHVRSRMEHLRRLVHSSAEEIDHLKELHETTKWAEPSFVTKHGSTLRMDWKEKKPEQYALYFQCSSRLVETFKIVFGDQLMYEANRAILFDLHQEIPETITKSCIKAALEYHKVKHLPGLGI